MKKAAATVAGILAVVVGSNGCAASGISGHSVSDALGPSTIASPAARPTPVTQGPWRRVGDVDGDGDQDHARVAEVPRRSSDGVATYRLSVRLSSGGMVTKEFAGQPLMPGLPAFARTQIIGGTDIGGDGVADIFVQDHHGASTAFMTIFGLVSRRLEQLTISGAPVELGVDGSVTHVNGFSCQPPVLEVWGDALATDSRHFIEITERYRVDGSSLVRMSRRESRVRQQRSGPFVNCGRLPSDVG